MYGLTRGTMTLIGVAVAGFLLWVATQFDVDDSGEYWAWLGLIAAAGLTMALSQLLGGWTKWGWPRVTGGVFLLGFLPALVAGGLVLLHAQPDEGAFGAGWAGDLGADGLAEDLSAVLPAIPFGLGLVFGFTFDTTGPRAVRSREVAVEHEREIGDRRYVAPAPVEEEAPRGDRVTAVDRDRDGVDDRDTAVDRDRDGVGDRDEAEAGSRVDRDRDGVDDRDEASRERAARADDERERETRRNG